MVGIWLVDIDNNITVVWTANRDDPPVTSNATLKLTKSGKLLLKTDEQGKEKPISTTSDSASFACMFDSGNFALYNKNDSIIWETFRYPTDTIFGGQLFSSASETDHSTGRYRLKMQYDGNFVLELANTVDDASEVYWESLPGGYSRNGYGLNKYHLVLNDAGLLQIINSTSMEVFKILLP